MKRRTTIHHPIHAAIEDVYAVGHTPRLQIDARRSDVTVPDSVRQTWQARLVIDLDPSYPLDLEFDAQGLAVDLAFQGAVTRCGFSWAAVYAVIDRGTGRGIVVEAHLPPPELPPDLVWVERAPRRPRLSAVPPASAPSRPVKSGTPSTAPVSASSEPQPSPSVPPGASATSDDAAKERRARFRVIDGGR